VAVDGKPVEYVGQLQQQIAFRKAGESVKVEVARKGGVRKTLEVRLQEVAAPKDVASRDDNTGDSADSSDEAAASIDLLGLTVQPVDQDAVQQFELEPGQRGLLVTGVVPGGPSDGEVADPDAGGPDIILSVEGKPVKSVADLKGALKGFTKDDIVSLRIYNTQAKSRRIERIRLGE
jgi:S1-C subfamily serine protease